MADYQSYLILFLTGALTSIFIIFRLSRPKSHLPPTPFAFPIIGHLHLLSPTPHRAFHNLSLQYGPIFRLFLGSMPCVVATSSQTAKELFKTYDDVFLDRPHNSSMDYISYGGKGFIFAPYGSYWKFLKKTVMSELLNGKTLDSLLPVRHDETNRFIECLSQKAKVGESVELKRELMKVTNNVISRMVMSKRCSDDQEGDAVDIRKIVIDIAKVMGTFNLSDNVWLCKNLDLQGNGKKCEAIRARFDGLIEKIMREHEEARELNEESGQVKDLLSILIDISEDENMEMKLTKENIKAFILDIFGGGTETSAVTIEWALSELINHPNILKKAVEEIDQIVGKSRLLQESDVPNLPYLQAIVKESLRLHPSAPVIQRLSTQDCTVGGYHIPAKTTVFFSIWSVGRDPTHWENPLEFRPERFIEKHLDVRGQHFHFLPFGSGRRMCPGVSLGLMVIHVTLGSMIQCFDWMARKDGDLTSLDMEEGVGITMPRANPLVCVPVARLDPIPFSTATTKSGL
ncbi:cytochrome P450 93A2-like [Cynara cardunculus var. scolymus]|uniref:cytochrome P450 93A2-like n=1 Tax=Cynara cardunculus var. scolymus TaxID=59895 RepID=UPI000D62D887|nr:cytochrome P450 93A2-like [Cynara cardunculus var. scolymus]